MIIIMRNLIEVHINFFLYLAWDPDPVPSIGKEPPHTFESILDSPHISPNDRLSLAIEFRNSIRSLAIPERSTETSGEYLALFYVRYLSYVCEMSRQIGKPCPP